MLPTDKLRSWRKDLLTDPRVVNFLDPERRSGRWFAEHPNACAALGEIAWDAYYLYGPEVRWEDSLPEPLTCGAPIVRTKEKLLEAMKSLETEAEPQP